MPIYIDANMDEDNEITEPNRRAPSSTSSSVIDDADVDRFLDELAGAGARMADLWEKPALLVSDEAVRLLDVGAAPFLASAHEGVAATKPEILSLDRPTPRIAIVTVRWPWLDERGNEIGAESSSYILRKDDDGKLKLRVAVLRG